MLADSAELGAFKLSVGECLVDTDGDAAGVFVAAALEADKAARDAGAARLAALVARQDALKAKLYARFGKSINLEDGEKK